MKNYKLSVLSTIQKLIKVFVFIAMISGHRLIIVVQPEDKYNVRPASLVYWDLDSCIIMSSNIYEACKGTSSGNDFGNSCIGKSSLMILYKKLEFHQLTLQQTQEIIGCHSLILQVDLENISNATYFQIFAKNQQFQKPNFHKQTVLATGVDDPENSSMLKYSKDAQENLEFSGGCSFRIAQDLEFLLNFTLKSTVSSDYIYEIENKTLGGIGQQLLNGSADIAIPLALFVPYRKKYLSILHPIVKEPIFAIFRQPHSTTARDVYINPFSKALWTSIIAMWVLFGILIFLFDYLLHLSKQHYKIGKPNCYNQEYWIIIFAAICQQGWYKSYTVISLRTLTFFSFLFGFILFAAYCAAIISTLSIQVVPIKAFEELIDNNFVILMNPIFQWGRYLRNIGTDDLDETEINYKDDETSVIKVLDGGSAFLNTLDYFIPIAQNQNYSDQFLCQTISTVNARELSSYSGFYVKKSSPLRKSFNYGLDFMFERGLNQRHYNRYLSETVLKCLTRGFRKELGVTTLHFWDVSTAFVIVIVGILSSVVVVLIEHITFNKHVKF